jgi:hypothetical protein
MVSEAEATTNCADSTSSFPPTVFPPIVVPEWRISMLYSTAADVVAREDTIHTPAVGSVNVPDDNMFDGSTSDVYVTFARVPLVSVVVVPCA